MNLRSLKESILGCSVNKYEVVEASGRASVADSIRSFRDIFLIMTGKGSERIERNEVLIMFAEWQSQEDVPEKYRFWDVDLTTNKVRSLRSQVRARSIQSRLQERAAQKVLLNLTENHRGELFALYDSVYDNKKVKQNI